MRIDFHDAPGMAALVSYRGYARARRGVLRAASLREPCHLRPVHLRARLQPPGMLPSYAKEIFSAGIYSREYVWGPKNGSWGSESRGGPKSTRR
jgi:hypothetical protein